MFQKGKDDAGVKFNIPEEPTSLFSEIEGASVRAAFLKSRFRWTGPRIRTLEVCFFLAFACCSCSAAFDSDRTIAQFAHTVWGPKDGAPRPVTALAQTPDGFL